MKKFDPTIFLVIFGLFFLMGAFDAPFLIWAVIGYFIYKTVNRKREEKDSRNSNRRRGGTDYRRNRRRNDQEAEYESRRKKMEETYRRRRQPTTTTRPKPTRRPQAPKNNPYKTSGIKKYKDFEYEAAIEDFNKALEIDDRDISVHFNLACAYSLTEQKEKSFHHITMAVENGFTDLEKIKTHDALAFIRIQDEFDAFEANGFKSTTNMKAESKEVLEENSALLEQLQQLAALRDKGLLTEEEFVLQKKKLLG